MEKTLDYFIEKIKEVPEIKGFSEDFRWLSNFYPIEPFLYKGIEYKTTENFYQSMKTTDIELRKHIANLSAGKSKRFCNKENNNFVERLDWLEIKLKVMEFALRQKFSQPFFRMLLLATEDKYIEETNSWNDIFFGCTIEGIGENHLGKILMRLRDLLRKNINLLDFDFDIN